MEIFNACVLNEGEYTCCVYGVVSLSCEYYTKNDIRDKESQLFTCIYQRNVLVREELGVKYIKILCDNPEANTDTILEDM